MAAFEEGNHLCFDILYKTSAGHGGQNDVLDFDYQAFGNGLAVGSADTGTLDPSHFVAAGAGASGPTDFVKALRWRCTEFVTAEAESAWGRAEQDLAERSSHI